MANLMKPGRCPICRKPAVEAFVPFCSARCADIDLNRWLSGAYVVETDEAPGDATRENEDGDQPLPIGKKAPDKRR